MNVNLVIMTLSIVVKNLLSIAGDKSTNIYFEIAYARALFMRVVANPVTLMPLIEIFTANKYHCLFTTQHKRTIMLVNKSVLM